MSAILITIAKIAATGQDALEQYAAGTLPLIQAAGGKVVCRSRLTEIVVGASNTRPDLVAVMRFDNPEAILNLLNSKEYRRQVPYRERAFTEIHSYIAEEI